MSANLKESLPRRIVIRCPNWLGDLVMSTPIFKDLRKRFPGAILTAMCQGSTGALIQEDPHLDEILNFKKPSGWLHRHVHGDTIQPLIQGNFDAGILLTNSFSSAWWFYRANIPQRIGFATHARSLLLTNAIPLPKNLKTQHLVTTYKKILEPFGIPFSSTPPALYLTEEEKLNASLKLQLYHIEPNDLIIGINAGAAYGEAKCWPLERFQALSQELLKNPRIKLLFFGDKSSTFPVEKICHPLSERAINLAGKTTLRELMALIACCHVFVTNDSGPMHMASALSIPVVALFGSTSDVATGPYQGGLVIHKHVPCSPCFRRECPIDFRCMKSIEVQEVENCIQEVIKKLP